MFWQISGNDPATTSRSWADLLDQAYVRLEPHLDHSKLFQGEIKKIEAARISFSRVRASAHCVSRLAEHISESASEVCFVNLQTEGVGLTRQRGQEVVSHPFDITIVDTTQPFDILHRADFLLYSLIVPNEVLSHNLMQRGVLSLSRSARGREIARTLMSYSGLALVSNEAGTPPLSIIDRHVVDLLSCLEDWVDNDVPKDENSRLSAICDYINRNLDDDGLSATKIAQVFGVSSRYVHKLFNTMETTVSAYLCDQRINRSREFLTRPDMAKITITEVAFQLGFRDLSYFNRRFKQATGETPTQFRQRWRSQLLL